MSKNRKNNKFRVENKNCLICPIGKGSIFEIECINTIKNTSIDQQTKYNKFNIKKFVEECPCQICPVMFICKNICMKRATYLGDFFKERR